MGWTEGRPGLPEAALVRWGGAFGPFRSEPGILDASVTPAALALCSQAASRPVGDAQHAQEDVARHLVSIYTARGYLPPLQIVPRPIGHADNIYLVVIIVLQI